MRRSASATPALMASLSMRLEALPVDDVTVCVDEPNGEEQADLPKPLDRLGYTYNPSCRHLETLACIQLVM